VTDALPWQYKNEVLASWYTVIKAYQRDNVFLGDSGRLLIQSTTYEMYSTFCVAGMGARFNSGLFWRRPASKKSNLQGEKQLTDLNRKLGVRELLFCAQYA
jgi:hypothetical protein